MTFTKRILIVFVAILLFTQGCKKQDKQKHYDDIFKAVMWGTVNNVEELLNSGTDASVSYDGVSLLHLACSYGHLEKVKLLVSRGANVNAPDTRWSTPLHYAVNAKDNDNIKEITAYLISKGAIVNKQNKPGETPLHYAVANFRPEVVNLLLSEGADVNINNNLGSTPLKKAKILFETVSRRGSKKKKEKLQECIKILQNNTFNQ